MEANSKEMEGSMCANKRSVSLSETPAKSLETHASDQVTGARRLVECESNSLSALSRRQYRYCDCRFHWRSSYACRGENPNWTELGACLYTVSIVDEEKSTIAEARTRAPEQYITEPTTKTSIVVCLSGPEIGRTSRLSNSRQSLNPVHLNDKQPKDKQTRYNYTNQLQSSFNSTSGNRNDSNNRKYEPRTVPVDEYCKSCPSYKYNSISCYQTTKNYDHSRCWNDEQTDRGDLAMMIEDHRTTIKSASLNCRNINDNGTTKLINNKNPNYNNKSTEDKNFIIDLNIFTNSNELNKEPQEDDEEEEERDFKKAKEKRSRNKCYNPSRQAHGQVADNSYSDLRLTGCKSMIQHHDDNTDIIHEQQISDHQDQNGKQSQCKIVTTNNDSSNITNPKNIAFIKRSRKKVSLLLLLWCIIFLETNRKLPQQRQSDKPEILINQAVHNDKPYDSSSMISSSMFTDGLDENNSHDYSLTLEGQHSITFSWSAGLILGAVANNIAGDFNNDPTSPWSDSLHNNDNNNLRRAPQLTSPATMDESHNDHEHRHRGHHHHQLITNRRSRVARNRRQNHSNQHHHVKLNSQHHEQDSLSNKNFKNTKRASRQQPPMSYDPLDTDRPIVMTNKGLVRGLTQKTVTGKSVDAFLGIPYAQPPIGRYRFRHPQAIQAWPGEWDANKMSNSCPQVNDTFFGANFPGTSIWNANTPIDEDCLYLNVWSPFGVANATIASHSIHHSNNKPKRPVLVWIFGGGFTSGTSSLSLYEGGLMASEEDIIVVSMNYRVAALGFLYLGRPDAPGNAGLFDQVMALQWISDNIDQFGGDPKRVTIFGESAGAVSASLHLLSPLSRNLFQQAILQSASATAPWAIKDTHEILLNGLQLATHLGCRGPNNEDLLKANQSITNNDLDHVLECMLKVEANELVKYEVGQSRTILKFPFVPVVDGSFLVEPPIESLIKKNFKPARLLVGSNGDEGNYWLIYLSELHNCSTQKQQQQQQLQQPSHLQQLLNQQQQLSIQDDNQRFKRNDRANQRQEWLDDVDRSTVGVDSGSEIRSTNNLINDNSPKYGFCRPNEQTITRDVFYKLLQREEVNPHLKYPIARDAILFEYTNWINPNDSLANNDALDKIFGDFQFSCPVQDFALRYSSAGNAVYMYHYKHRSSISAWPKWMGVLHGDEINFIFGEPLNPAFNYTPLEVEFSKRMMRYWANFAKSGDPSVSAPNASLTADDRWPEYSDKKQYKELSAATMNTPRIGHGPRAKQCAFWSYHLPRLLESFERSNNCSNPNRPKMPPIDLYDLYPSPYTIATSQTFNNRINSNNKFLNTSNSILISLMVILSIIGIIILLAKQQNWLFFNPLLTFLGIQNNEPSSATNPNQTNQQNNPSTTIDDLDGDADTSSSQIKRRINNNNNNRGDSDNSNNNSSSN